MKFQTPGCLLGMVAVSLASAGLAQAQERERAGIIVGEFLTKRASETRVDSDVGVGTDINLENDLGLSRTVDVGRIGGYVWYKKRQRFDFSHFDLSRTSSRRIDKTIAFGNETFQLDTVVTTRDSVKITKADFTWAPLSRDRGYLGLTGGLYVGKVQLSLSEPTLGTAETERLTAPLPVVGVRGEYAITKRVTLAGVSQLFAIDTGNASGRLSDVYVGVDYRFGKRFGVGVAYNDVAMNIEAEDGLFVGRVDWGYNGWLMYFKTEFGKR